jgi:hypothetical protein
MIPFIVVWVDVASNNISVQCYYEDATVGCLCTDIELQNVAYCC